VRRLRLLTGGESHGPRLTAVLEGLPSVALATGEASTTAQERSDVTAIDASPVFVEAALALVLPDALLERVGGDALADLSAPPG
jgi:chorismate synthase